MPFQGETIAQINMKRKREEKRREGKKGRREEEAFVVFVCLFCFLFPKSKLGWWWWVVGGTGFSAVQTYVYLQVFFGDETVRSLLVNVFFRH